MRCARCGWEGADVICDLCHETDPDGPGALDGSCVLRIDFEGGESAGKMRAERIPADPEWDDFGGIEGDD